MPSTFMPIHRDGQPPAHSTRTSHRLTRRIAVTAVLGGLVAGIGAAPASAEPRPAQGSTVEVDFTPQGPHVTTPPPIDGPTLTMQVTDSDSAEHLLTVFTLKPGSTVAQTLKDLTTEMTTGGPPAAQATRNLVRDATFVGGVDITAGQTLSSTAQHLRPGTYYMVDPTAATSPGGSITVLNTFTVRGTQDDSRRGAVSAADDSAATATAKITLTSADRFQLSGTLRTGEPVIIDNDGNTIHFVDFVAVTPGTTDTQLQAYFDSFGPTGPGLPDPEIGPGSGESLVSPSTQQVLTPHLAAGDYALECFIADDTTGMPHAFMGMHLIVHVH